MALYLPWHTKVYEDEHCVAILDLFPLSLGHTLLIPKIHFVTMHEMPEEIASAVLPRLPALARAVTAASGAPGLNIVQNNGAEAGQVVP